MSEYEKYLLDEKRRELKERLIEAKFKVAHPELFEIKKYKI